ncbi:hypothetical protein N8380_03305 [Planktomarina temperata]|nr:hypothetical protein [Planktomarina temperata]
MVRFISAPILYCMVSTVLVPISAEAQDFKRSFWLHSALAQATETRQAPFTVSLAPGLNSVIGNAAMAGIGLSVVGALALGQTDQVSGAGGSLSQNALPTGDYRDTTQGAYGTEYRYNANLAQLNVLPLNNYGYDGTGINVAVVDSGIDASHPEFLNSTIRGYDFPIAQLAMVAIQMGMERMWRRLLPVMRMVPECAGWPMMPLFILIG